MSCAKWRNLLHPETSWIFSGVPSRHVCVPLTPDQVHVIKEPSAFFNLLKEKSSSAQHRITWSSLYLGTGVKEQELVDEMQTALENKPNLDVTLLLDYTRGTRMDGGIDKPPPRSSNELLLPLVRREANVSFYLSPDYGTWFRRKFILPTPKVNEVISLQHMKCFVFDDDVIISGANLSDQYFTNRMDRYFLIKNKTLADYFHHLVKTVSSFSMQLRRDGTFQLHPSWTHHPLFNRIEFVREASLRIQQLQSSFNQDTVDFSNKKHGTFALPFLQMKSFGLEDDVQFTSNALSSCPPGSQVKLASGYFNLTQDYIRILLNRSRDLSTDVLMASQSVNSFYGAKGLIGKIPSVYTACSFEFFKQIQSTGDGDNLRLWSFLKPKWTFHSKGLWIKSPDNWLMATIGSPNFGYRSESRDLESQLVIVTKDVELQNRLEQEYEDIFEDAKAIKKADDFEHVSWWVRLVSPYIKSYF